MMESLTNDIYDAALKVIKEVMLNIFMDILQSSLPFDLANSLMQFVTILSCTCAV